MFGEERAQDRRHQKNRDRERKDKMRQKHDKQSFLMDEREPNNE
jgi:hypothetical protein